MPYTDHTKIIQIAAEQQAQPGPSSMADRMKRKKGLTYNESADVISHGVFFNPANFDPFTYPHMTPAEIDVVRDRNFHIIRSIVLNHDEDIALNDDLDWMVLAQVDHLDLMSSKLCRTVNRAKGEEAKRQVLNNIYKKAVETVLWLHHEGYGRIKRGLFQ